MELIKVRSVDEQTRTLLMGLPNGKAFERKFDTTSNLYKYWNAISRTFVLFEENLNTLANELLPQTTEQLITNWEKEYGIPDGVFLADGTIEERRRDILAKIGANGLKTKEDFESYFTFIGYDVEILLDGNAEGLYTWDWIWQPSPQGAGHPWSTNSEERNRFWVVVKFNEYYPNLDALKSFVEKLVPANVYVEFITQGE